jgi:hypothetical protein
MTDEHTRELIQAGIDGELDAAGEAELRQVLADSEEARHAHSELARLAEFLHKIPDLEPPPDLQARIVQGIQLSTPPSRKRFFKFNGASPLFRYGFAGAAALVLAIAITANRDELGDAGDVSSMVGTMTRPAGVSGVNVIDRFTVASETVNGEVTLELGQGGALLLNARLASSGDFELDLDFSGSGLGLDAFAQMDSRLEAISYSGDLLRVAGRGQQKFVVMLNPAQAVESEGQSRIDLVLRKQGVPVQSGSLKLVNAPG